MVSRDAARTLAFYGGLLGLDLVKRTVNFDDPGVCHLYFGSEYGQPGTILTFFEWAHARPGHAGVGGVHHLALGVATPEAQLKWKRRLVDAGVKVSGPIDRSYFMSMYFEDPDGQILEIATAGPGYAIDEAPDELGKKLLVPPVERMPENRDERASAAATHPEPVRTVSEDMKLQGIHHISGITDDLECASDFYAEALGLSLVKKTYNQDDGAVEHYFWAHYDGEHVAPNSSYTLFGWPGSSAVARPGAGQTHHFAFRAKDDDDQAAWREHLLSIGIDVSQVMERNYFRSIYFNAPDGQLLEIATDGPGFAVDESIESLGSALQLPSWLEPRRGEIQGALNPLV